MAGAFQGGEMATASDIINRAYAMLGFKDASEPVSGNDADYALGVLNSLIDSWNTQSLFIVSVNEVIATVGAISATVGPGLTFDTVRPPCVEAGAFSRLNGVDYPIEWIDRQTYESITLKTVSSSFPQYAYYDANMPTANIFFYPVPITPIEIHVPIQQQFTEFADQVTDYALAPGYQRALEYTLAEELAPGIRPVDPQVTRNAMIARRAIRRTNVNVPQMNVDLPNVRFNIYSGL